MRKQVYIFIFFACLLNSHNYVKGKINDEGCGIVAKYESKRIVGGSISRPWPWLSAIILIEETFLETRWGEFCGASLIDQKWLITAAHCIINEELFEGVDVFNMKVSLGNIKIVLGQTNIGNAPGYTYYIKQAHVHPNYNFKTSDFDVALLELVEPVTYSDTIKPVCLDLDEKFKCNTVDCPTCMASGWGSTDGIDDPASTELREVERHMTSNMICKLFYRHVTDRMQCFGTGKLERGVCSGDSGGPIMCERDNLWHQTAVISRGVVDEKGECGTKLSFGLHTKLSSPGIRNWIYDTTGQ